MKVLLNRVMKVKKEIQHYVLTKYIDQCRKKHTIAFIEWRLHFSSMRLNNNHSAQMEISDIEEIIDTRLDQLKNDFVTCVNQFKINDQTIIDGYCPIKSNAKYEFDSSGSDHQYKINSFCSIGWSDPLPMVLEEYNGKFTADQLAQPTEDQLS